MNIQKPAGMCGRTVVTVDLGKDGADCPFQGELPLGAGDCGCHLLALARDLDRGCPVYDENKDEYFVRADCPVASGGVSVEPCDGKRYDNHTMGRR